MHIKTIALTVCLLAVAADVQSPIFPYGVPKEKPDMPLSRMDPDSITSVIT